MAFRSSAVGHGNGTTATATPAGVQVGDYLCGVLTRDGTTDPVTAPAGWTRRVTLNLAGPDGQLMIFADKIAAGGDDFAWQSTGNAVAINAAFSGRNQTSPRTAVTGEKNETSNATPITVSHSGLTAATGDDIAVFMQLDQTVQTDDWTSSQISNYTEQQDDTTEAWVTVAFDTRDNVSAGATGALSCTATRGAGTGNAGWGVIAVAIAIAGATTAQLVPAFTQTGGSYGVQYV